MAEVFDVDAYLEEADLTPLSITVKGKPYTLPHFASLSLDQAMKIDDGNVKDMLVEVCGQDTADVLAALPGKALNEILKRWQAQAETEPGEDVASSRS